MPTLQVTLPSSGKTQISVHGIGYRQLIVQNNTASDSVRVGDSTIVAGAYGTGKGLLIASGGNYNSGPSPVQIDVLSNKYLAGTAGDVIDVEYAGA